MKFLIALSALMPALMATASASEGTDLRPMLFDVNCVSKFEGKETRRVFTVKREGNDEQGITKLVLRLNDSRVKKSESDFTVNLALQIEESITVKAMNRNGRELTIELVTGESMESDGSFPAEMFIKEQALDYLKLTCNVGLAG